MKESCVKRLKLIEEIKQQSIEEYRDGILNDVKEKDDCINDLTMDIINERIESEIKERQQKI